MTDRLRVKPSAENVDI